MKKINESVLVIKWICVVLVGDYRYGSDTDCHLTMFHLQPCQFNSQTITTLTVCV